MAAKFKKEFFLPAVPIPDWDLVSRLDDLFRPYLPAPTANARFAPLFRASGARGRYVADNAAELRKLVEAQEQLPTGISRYAQLNELFLHVWMKARLPGMETGGAGAQFESRDERIVNHLKVRT
jgi:hypothetical protein